MSNIQRVTITTNKINPYFTSVTEKGFTTWKKFFIKLNLNVHNHVSWHMSFFKTCKVEWVLYFQKQFCYIKYSGAFELLSGAIFIHEEKQWGRGGYQKIIHPPY